MPEATRRDLFRYLAANDGAEDYLAILDVFTATLLADLSAAEVCDQLVERGIAMDRDTAQDRCNQLVAWGNLVPSIRDTRVTTVAEYLRSRSRYQVSKLGGRVHREARAVMEAASGAREVARELLGQIVDALDRVLAGVAETGRPDAEALAGEVTAIFNNQRVFTESVRDFYAYLAGVLSRYDLGGEEYAQFKRLLLEYVDLIAADVNRHAPAVTVRIEQLLPDLDRLLHLLADLPGLTRLDGTPVERAEGRDKQEWLELAAWYGTGTGTSSGPEQLRTAAAQALGQLITNAKRLLDTTGTGYSRRADLLRLASWFDRTDDASAHRIFAATFRSYPARHLSLGPDEEDRYVPPTTSWWSADPVDVPISLRERGDRTVRGRSSRVPDPGKDRARLARLARKEAESRRAVAAELITVGRLHGGRLSAAARDLLLDLVSDLFARQQDTAVDTDLGLELVADPGRDTVIHGDDGILTIDGYELVIRRLDEAGESTGTDGIIS